MKIVCPTCNTSYNISSSKVPQRGIVATCKKCGGQIAIEPSAEKKPDYSTQAEPLSGSPSSYTQEAPPLIPKTGEFEFTMEHSGFKGYAGFWKRFAAAIIDGFILMVVGFVIGGLGIAEGVRPLSNILGIVVGWLYFATMESSSKQGTLGKMALGIKVTDLSGNAISFGKATVRHFSKIISTIILLVGYLMVGFTARKQALHDMVAGCLVVNRR